MMERRQHSPPIPAAATTAARIESFACPELLPNPRKKNNKIKRRFNDEQVKLLESMFESETKLEPRKKVQLAREVGLQPRQVAIWFQNRRARWKSKHIEKEYRILSANYDNLKSQFESLKKEKQSMIIQLQKLSDLLEQSRDRNKDSNGLAGNRTDGVSDNAYTNCEYEVNPGCSQEGSDHTVVMALDDDKSKNIGCTGLEEGPKLLNMDEHVDGSAASPEKWCRVDACGLFDQPCSDDSHWWDFWTS